MKMTAICIGAWLAGMLCAGACLAATSDSIVDSQFGADLGAGGGQARVAFDQGGSNSDRPVAVLRTAAGKYLVVTLVATDALQDSLGLARFNPDGSLDTSFGNGGRIISNLLTNPAAAVLDAHERIVVVGTNAAQQFAVARFLANGTPDPGFAGTGGTGAYPHVQIGGNASAGAGAATAVVIDPQGFIVVGGNTGGAGQFDHDIDFIWFTDAGAFDHEGWRLGESAAGGCTEIVGTTIVNSHVYAMAINRDGTIVAAGSCFNRAALYVVNAPGCAADFETGAPVLNAGDPSAGNSASGAAFDAWGRVLVAGSDGTKPFITRLGPDFCGDATFGGTQPGTVPGETWLDLPGTTTESLVAVAPRSDGSVVGAGSVDGSMLVARLDSHGGFDDSFDAGQNYRAYPFAAGVVVTTAMLVDGGRPLVAGMLFGGSPGGVDVALLRLQSDLVFKTRFEPEP